MNIIKFPDKNVPDVDCVYQDGNGETWYKFEASYYLGERQFSFYIWARSEQEAENILIAPMSLRGQVLHHV